MAVILVAQMASVSNSRSWHCPMKLTVTGWNSLEAPPSDKVLQVLAVGRGIFNYSCEDIEATDPPTFVDQYTELYNAAPLIPTLPNEQAFHDLIPGLCDFDYGQLHNSTLECLGTVGTLNGSAVLTLYDIVTFETVLEQKLAAPDDPMNNGLWARSRSLDHTWEMYRVEMAGGSVPATCQGLDNSFEVNYAAEYWFYHIRG